MKRMSLVLVTALIALSGCVENENTKNNGKATWIDPYLPVIDQKGDEEISGVIRSVDTRMSGNVFNKVARATVKVRTNSGWGTGFFINDEGYIVTNHHVIAGASKVKIHINGENRTVSARKVGYAECSDLAVLRLTTNTKIQPYDNSIVYLDWYSQRASLGQRVGVMGYPADSQDDNGVPLLTYNEGVVNTNTYEHNNFWSSAERFTHSARTAGGNSGGPVFDVATGNVVGVHYAGNTKGELLYRNYALSSIEIKQYVETIMNGRNILSIGITPRVYQHSNGRYLGVLVKSIIPGDPASKIGMRPNDIITELQFGNLQNDRTLGSYCDILRSNNPNEPDNDVVEIKIQRYTTNNRWVSCVGELNGNGLVLEGDNTRRCPSPAKITMNENYITSGQSTILDPDTIMQTESSLDRTY